MSHSSQTYANAINFTPIFNCSNLQSIFGGNDGNTIKLENDLMKSLETILFPKSLIKIKKIQGYIAEIETEEYLCDKLLFTDTRFLQISEGKLNKRKDDLPSKIKIIEKMRSLLGQPYLWGGNSTGILEISRFYPPINSIDSLSSLTKQHWLLEGVDCSGLLYFATNGNTPRNTSELVNFGKNIEIENKKVQDWQLKALDLIVWQGHVIIMLDEHTTIESLAGKGVVTFSVDERIKAIQNELKRNPANDWNSCKDKQHSFVIKRWIF